MPAPWPQAGGSGASDLERKPAEQKVSRAPVICRVMVRLHQKFLGSCHLNNCRLRAYLCVCTSVATEGILLRSLNQTYRLTIMYKCRSQVYWLGCCANASRVMR